MSKKNGRPPTLITGKQTKERKKWKRECLIIHHKQNTSHPSNFLQKKKLKIPISLVILKTSK